MKSGRVIGGDQHDAHALAEQIVATARREAAELVRAVGPGRDQVIWTEAGRDTAAGRRVALA